MHMRTTKGNNYLIEIGCRLKIKNSNMFITFVNSKLAAYS